MILDVLYFVIKNIFNFFLNPNIIGDLTKSETITVYFLPIVVLINSLALWMDDFNLILLTICAEHL